jgi:tetratricopeptide (TPR) repeat protein
MVIEQVRQGRAPALRDGFFVATRKLAEQRPLHSPILRQIEASIRSNRLETAEKDLRFHLSQNPDDPDALHLAAQVENRLKRPAKAVQLLAHCLELAPGFIAARFEYANTLRRVHELTAALDQAEMLLKNDADNPLFLQLQADLFATVGEVEKARAILEQLTTQHPTQAEIWRRYGDIVRALGQQENAIDAYRKAIECVPWFGLAWSNLASMQIFRFTDDDIRAMQEHVRRVAIEIDDRINILFALGKAYEDRRDYERSWIYYDKAHAAKRIQRSDAVQSSGVTEQLAVFTPAFLHSRETAGCPAPDPIFVVGRPRSGTTLIEHILSSHSSVEGTGERPYIAGLASRLGNFQTSKYGIGYAGALSTMDSSELEELGEEYLRKVQVHRRLRRPFFVDKNPANYFHLGLIRLILPNAKIIDVRRNPAANCLSVFKLNHRGLNLRLSDVGRDYRNYVQLMAHFDRVLPGWIHRVFYEELVANPEAEIRSLLGYLRLPFEASCLRFHETARAVRTPSSEQVRQPIYTAGLEHWRNFEPWLAPLLASLGSVYSDYPAVPEELRGARPSS